MTRPTEPSPPAAPPVVVIAGPTAGGKSALALELAAWRGGTIINADSQQVYRDLRILSARPDAASEARVPHLLYGFVDAAERFSVARWRELAEAEIAAAEFPVVAGGTGLYLRALQRGLAPVPAIPQQVRAEAAALYRRLGGAAFRALLGERDPAAARLAEGDRQRLLRAWEVVAATGTTLGDWQRRAAAPRPLRFLTILVLPPREELYAACDARFVRMIECGALAEAAALAARKLAPDLPAMKALGVPELLRHLSGEISLDEAVAAAQQATRRYAKRQLTWFRHQMTAELTVAEQLSESLLHRLRHFVDDFLLTPSP